MNTSDSLHRQSHAPEVQTLDDELRGFFLKEMPEPWPTFRMPTPAHSPHDRLLQKSRWALAASIALIFGGTLLLAGQFDGSRQLPTTPGRAEAKNRPSLQGPHSPRPRRLATPTLQLDH